MPRACRLRGLLLLAAAPGAARADTAAAEVAALLDFCSANPGMSYDEWTSICGSGSLYSYGAFAGQQWGNGDPCTGGRWYGVTCAWEGGGWHVTAMCALFLAACPLGSSCR